MFSTILPLYDLPVESDSNLSATNTSNITQFAGATCSCCRDLSCLESHSKLAAYGLHSNGWHCMSQCEICCLQNPKRPTKIMSLSLLWAVQNAATYVSLSNEYPTMCSRILNSQKLQPFLTMPLNFYRFFPPILPLLTVFIRPLDYYPNACLPDPISKVS